VHLLCVGYIMGVLGRIIILNFICFCWKSLNRRVDYEEDKSCLFIGVCALWRF